MKKGKTNLPFEKGENLLVVRYVSALVCNQCGDSFIEFNNVQIVEEIIASAVMLGFIKFINVA